MKINPIFLDKVSYLYLGIPLFIFLLTWLNPLFAAISSLTLCTILYILFKAKQREKELPVSKKVLTTTVITCMVWVFLSGIGGMFYQNTDWHMRNALLNDLVNFTFPVKYDNNVYLVYYMGLMLPAAVFGKLVHLFGASEELSIRFANLFNYLWCTTGIFIISLQLFDILRAKNKQFYFILLVLIFFSGLDIITNQPQTRSIHIEWHGTLQYSSNYTQLFWVYNQAIASWLITLLLYKNPYKIQIFAFLGTLMLFYSPLPWIGLSICLISLTAIKFIKNCKLKALNLFFKRVFSIHNILCILFIFPIIYFYYKSNTMLETPVIKIFYFNWSIFKFFLYEAGIFLILMFLKYRKFPLYYVVFLSLLLIPHIRFGEALDFCMRASIPALFILMVLVLNYLFDKRALKVIKTLLIVCLTIGAITPAYEFYRGFYRTFNHNDNEDYIKNQIQTLNNKIKKPCEYIVATERDVVVALTNYCNYGSADNNDTVFFKYLVAKKNLK